MSTLHRLVKVFGLSFLFVASAYAGTNPHVTAHPEVRVVEKVDATKVVSLPNTHPQLVAGVPDLGRVTAGTTYKHVMLVLKSTDAQEFALQGLLDQQQDKLHANYHQWLTPDTFGASFGVASADIAKVTAWMQDSGFTIENVAKGGRIIQFTATSGQLESAFHTEMHSYMVNGAAHVSNSTDISIPQALSPVVAGVGSLNNFPLKHDLKALKVTRDSTGNVTSSTPMGPRANLANGGNGTFPNGEFVGAADLSVIYDTAPLLAKGINGTGVTIGIIGQTDVLLSDIQIYRSIFNLPVLNFNRIQIGADPGTIADDGESDLDLEVSGAMAPNAAINFYTSGNSYFGGGIDASMEFVIEDNNADIISESYGECEQNLGAGGNAFYNIIYEQAAAQGQSIFISSGDDGPDTCGTYYNATTGLGGYSVNGLGSTPYNVSVGGTQFNEGATYNSNGTTPYWTGTASGQSASPYLSALSFIPDQPWNESFFGTGTYGGLTGGGSGISFYYQQPNYQVGPGVPTADPKPPTGSYETTLPAAQFVVPGPHRYMPDVALNAAVYHDGTIFCSEGSCTLSPTGQLSNFGIVGGTSVASPEMAGVQALVDQANGGRQGVPNFYYYKLAAAQSATSCISSAYVANAGCSFHDSQAGNNDVPAVRNSTTQEIGWNAAPGYDLAIGLGSPDATNLVNNWKTVNFNPTTTTLTLTPTTSTHGSTVNTTITVAPVSGSGTPTGNVGIVAQALYGGLGFYTLSGGTAGGTLTGLPAGTYNVYAHYSGDTTYAASNSAGIQVTVGTETPAVAAATYLLATNGALTATTQFQYGANVYINAGVAPASGVGIPSGAITFALSRGGAALTPYTTNVDPNGTTIGSTVYNAGAYFDAGLGLAAYDIVSSYPVLPVGTYTATVSYAGDTTFPAATAAPITFVVGPATPTVTVTAASADVVSAGTVTLTASVTTLSAAAGGLPATGTFTFTDTTTNTVLGTSAALAELNPLTTNATVTFTTNNLLTPGAHSIVGVYSGDTNYATATAKAVTVTVGGLPTVTTISGITPAAPQVGNAIVVSVAVTPAAVTGGTVTFFQDGLSLGAVTLTAASKGLATVNVGATLLAGPHVYTATYGGVVTTSALTTYAASSSTSVSLTILKNTPALLLSAQPNSSQTQTFAEQAILAPSPNNVGTKGAAPAPTGAIQFLDAANGAAATTLGTSTAAFQPGGYEDYVTSFNTGVLVPGYHVLSATYPGDANYAAATSNTSSTAIGITTLSVVTSSTNVGTNYPFTLTATITPLVATTTAIGGTVTFYDGAPGTGLILGTGPVTVSGGKAVLTTAKLATVATHTITAVYSGDAHFYTSTFATGLTVVAVTPGFTIAVKPTSLTIAQGTSGTVAVTATTFGNYTGSAPLTCSGLPANSYCGFTFAAGVPPQYFTFPGADTTFNGTLTITALKPHAVKAAGFNGMLWLPVLALAGFLGLRRKQLSARGRQMMVLAILLCGTMATTACSSLGLATPTGTYTVTITANGVPVTTTPQSSPAIQPTTTLALTVTQ